MPGLRNDETKCALKLAKEGSALLRKYNEQQQKEQQLREKQLELESLQADKDGKAEKPSRAKPRGKPKIQKEDLPRGAWARLREAARPSSASLARTRAAHAPARARVGLGSRRVLTA